MLIGIDPLLSGELLKILDEMGHGDQLLLVDRNYPAYAAGKPVVRLGEVSTERAAEAILSVFPLDSFVRHPLEKMEVEGDPAQVTEAHAGMLAVARSRHGDALEIGGVPRHDFYQRAKDAYAVVQTLEQRPYACFILQKGVVND